jgi:hypothetical protein
MSRTSKNMEIAQRHNIENIVLIYKAISNNCGRQWYMLQALIIGRAR